MWPLAIFAFLFLLQLLAAQPRQWLSSYSASCFAHPDTILFLHKKVTLKDAGFLCRLAQELSLHPETLAFAREGKLFQQALSKLKKKAKAASLEAFLNVFSEEEKKKKPATLSFPFFSYQAALTELSEIKIATLPPVELQPGKTFAYPLSEEESFFFSSFTSFLEPTLLKNFRKLPRNPFPP